MPIKIGKSKSSSGTELIHTNSCPDETNNQIRKNRGLKQFFNLSKCNSKIQTGRSSATEESTNNIKSTRTLGKAIDNIIAHRTESSPVNSQIITCHSVSPKLYTNSCASSIEELSKVALNTNVNSAIPSSAVTCSPITDVIFEEDYEDALLLKKRMGPFYEVDDEHVSKENIQHLINSSSKINYSIYNEPNDSAQGLTKEIIETCRRCEIKPTNHVNDIRSRSGGDADHLLVYPDEIVGGRSSTNSLSQGSAMTLSDSGAVMSSTNSPQVQLDNNDVPAATSIKALSINIQTNLQSISGPPTLYTKSPMGNTVICHHPASPFAPPTGSKPHSSSNPSTSLSTVANSSPSSSPMPSLFQESAPNFISRRPGRFINPVPNKCPGKQITDDIIPLSDDTETPKHSQRRSEYYKHPVYEEAWDLKLKRLCQDMAQRSNPSSMKRPIDNGPNPTPHLTAISFDRPQSAAGTHQTQTDSPISKFSPVPPAVPPHRRCSAHVKIPHCNSFEDSKSYAEQTQISQSISDCRDTHVTRDDSSSSCHRHSQRPHHKHNVNPTFDDQGNATDYDYAYNETWNLGVQFNMSINLSNDSTDSKSAIERKDSLAANNGYMDKIDSGGSEESSSLSTSQEASGQTKDENICDTMTGHDDDENANIDNDSLSNDSYEEPWDVRHGRVISELTSARLIDPSCLLTTKDQISGNLESNSNDCLRSQRNHEQMVQNSSRLLSAIAGGVSINKSMLLDDQPWYHVNCSRLQAEKLLVDAVEGSFLVRRCETSKNDYSLTIRHRHDYLHMKISRTSKGFILGQYSQPYSTIPQMLHHYSLTMVPVKGADSVVLKNPIVR